MCWNDRKMPYQKAIALLNEGKSLYSEINVVAGEYFHYDSDMKWLLSLRKEDKVRIVEFSTNGTCLTKEKLDILHNHFQSIEKKLRLNFSIDGSCKEVNLFVRGTDKFDYILEMVDYAKQFFDCACSCTLSYYNYDDWKLIPSVLCEHAKLQFSIDFNRGLKVVDEFGNITDDNFKQFINELQKYQEISQHVIPLIDNKKAGF
jgi:sulfatase maturation enzyme AslB (radical SAM superfamily)